MKFLKNFESVEFDDDSIKDLFLPIIDLGCVDFKFDVNSTTSGYKYNVSWKYKIDLFLSEISELPNFKRGTRKLNEIIEESYLILETLTSMSFIVDNYDIDFNGGMYFKEAEFTLDINLNKWSKNIQ